MPASQEVRLCPYDARLETELVAMWRESFEFGVGVADPHPIAEQVGYFRAKVLSNCELRVAMQGPALVGFIAATPASIEQLYIRVGAHRRGIGTMLVEWAKAQSIGSLRLFTFARNHVACAFYERHGFVEERRGFEPEWGLHDVLYHWQRPDAPWK